MIPILLFMLLLPFAGILGVIISKKGGSAAPIAVAVIELLLFFYVARTFLSSGPFGESYQFLPNIANFDLYVGSLNIAFVFLTSIVFLAASMASAFFMKEEKIGHGALMMLAECSVLGMFLSGNLLVLYLFWDLAIVSFFFMLFHFGGFDRRYASVKFIIYSLLSSSLLLIGIIMIYFYMPSHTLSISQLVKYGYTMPRQFQTIVFILLMLAFIIKMPVFPLHSWAIDAYPESPPGGAMLLSGVLSKFGVYGMLILFISLPVARNYSLVVALLLAFSALYGAATAMVQKDIKRMLSYLSISEVAIVGFAIATFTIAGIDGAIFGSVSHALIISLLFLLAFSVEKVFGTTLIGRLSGILSQYRLIGYGFLFGIFASIGLPLTTGFITDLLVFVGGVESFGLLILALALAIAVNASYLFWMYERAFLTGKNANMFALLDKDAEASIFMLIAFIVLIGAFPSIVLNMVGALI
ncbi:MAG: complex I subunit 4 family protein [Candidatus Micrarchaeia archaeon]